MILKVFPIYKFIEEVLLCYKGQVLLRMESARTLLIIELKIVIDRYLENNFCFRRTKL